MIGHTFILALSPNMNFILNGHAKSTNMEANGVSPFWSYQVVYPLHFSWVCALLVWHQMQESTTTDFQINVTFDGQSGILFIFFSSWFYLQIMFQIFVHIIFINNLTKNSLSYISNIWNFTCHLLLLFWFSIEFM